MWILPTYNDKKKSTKTKHERKGKKSDNIFSTLCIVVSRFTTKYQEQHKERQRNSSSCHQLKSYDPQNNKVKD